ncbi:hypothetical protein BKA65DRAFT_24128 [Rhexocercosporidium sp. MPI-PUGE-AT-0058]|nr:hypothetical protein BKA65DRAFT_24128 [Rhexocercosporidium sp. MPI-PUGE-AT-0058]
MRDLNLVEALPPFGEGSNENMNNSTVESHDNASQGGHVQSEPVVLSRKFVTGQGFQQTFGEGAIEIMKSLEDVPAAASGSHENEMMSGPSMTAPVQSENNGNGQISGSMDWMFEPATTDSIVPSINSTNDEDYGETPHDGCGRYSTQALHAEPASTEAAEHQTVREGALPSKLVNSDGFIGGVEASTDYPNTSRSLMNEENRDNGSCEPCRNVKAKCEGLPGHFSNHPCVRCTKLNIKIFCIRYQRQKALVEARLSCQFCITHHLQCTGEQPCSNCKEINFSCRYTMHQNSNRTTSLLQADSQSSSAVNSSSTGANSRKLDELVSLRTTNDLNYGTSQHGTLIQSHQGESEPSTPGLTSNDVNSVPSTSVTTPASANATAIPNPTDVSESTEEEILDNQRDWSEVDKWTQDDYN